MEFAVIAPLLVTLVFGMLEFSRLMMVEQLLTNASREGARTGVLAGSSASDVRTTVQNYLSNSGLSVSDPANQINVGPDPSTSSAGTAITVTINLPWSSVSWPVSFFLTNQNLSATAVMRKESS